MDTIPTYGETPRQIAVDPEHFGIRALIPVLLFGGLVGGFLLGRLLASVLPEDWPLICVAPGMAIFSAVLLVQFGENVIKPNWGSGRKIELTQQQMQFNDHRRKPHREYIFNWNEPFNVRCWYFEIKKGTRVPKGWYCMSLSLYQDDQNIILYTFFDPEKVQNIPGFKEYFTQLLPRKQREELARTNPRQAAQQNTLRELEGTRWFDGAEVKKDDFIAVMSLIEAHHSDT